MLEDLFGLFSSVLGDLPNLEWFIAVIASASLFAIGCLIKFLLVKDS